MLFHSSPSQSQVKPDPLTSPVTLFVMHSCPARDVDMRVRERERGLQKMLQRAGRARYQMLHSLSYSTPDVGNMSQVSQSPKCKMQSAKKRPQQLQDIAQDMERK